MKNWKSVLLGVVMGASTLTLAAQDDGGVSEAVPNEYSEYI